MQLCTQQLKVHLRTTTVILQSKCKLKKNKIENPKQNSIYRSFSNATFQNPLVPPHLIYVYSNFIQLRKWESSRYRTGTLSTVGFQVSMNSIAGRKPD